MRAKIWLCALLAALLFFPGCRVPRPQVQEEPGEAEKAQEELEVPEPFKYGERVRLDTGSCSDAAVWRVLPSWGTCTFNILQVQYMGRRRSQSALLFRVVANATLRDSEYACVPGDIVYGDESFVARYVPSLQLKVQQDVRSYLAEQERLHADK